MCLTTERQHIGGKKLIELQEEIDESTIIVRDLITPIRNGQIHQQKISKDMVKLNSTIKQLDVTDIQRRTTFNKRIHSLLKLARNSPRHTIFWTIKHTLTHLKN